MGLTLFLHEYGYNLFNLGRLTYPEINFLVDAHNEKQKREEQELKKHKAKGKSK